MSEPSVRPAAAVLFATFIAAELTWVTALMSGPAYQRVLGLTDTQLGLGLGAIPLGSLLMSGIVGHITARYGPRRILRIGVAGMILGLVAIASSRNFTMLLPALILAGFSAATLHNAGITLLSDLFPKNTRRIMALAAALWFGSSVVWAPSIGAWLAFAHTHGIQRWSYALPCGVGILLLSVCLALAARVLGGRSRRPPGARPQPAPAPRLPGMRWLWLPALGFGHGLLIVTFISWANPMIQRSFDLGDFHGGLAFALFALGLSAGRVFLAFRQAIRNDLLLLGISASTGGGILALALALPSYPWTLAEIGTGAFLASATAPCLFSLVAGRFPRSKSRLYGYLEVGISSGALLGPFLVGFLVDRGLAVHLAMMLSPAAGIAMGAISFARLATERGGAVRIIPASGDP